MMQNKQYWVYVVFDASDNEIIKSIWYTDDIDREMYNVRNAIYDDEVSKWVSLNINKEIIFKIIDSCYESNLVRTLEKWMLKLGTDEIIQKFVKDLYLEGCYDSLNEDIIYKIVSKNRPYDIIYIGKSKNAQNRIYSHRQYKYSDKDVTMIEIDRCSKDKTFEIETKWIRYYINNGYKLDNKLQI